MARPYVQERQSEYWTTKQIEDFFENCGTDVHTLPIPQRIEHKIPADFIFIPEHTIKLFGIQYKALYKGNASDYWQLYQHQHNNLQNYDWIYYGFSELKHRSQKRNSLHLLKIYVPTTFSYPPGGKFNQSGSPSNNYYRWGGFYKYLEACKCGLKLNSQDDLARALGDSYMDVAQGVQLYIHNFDTGVTININPLFVPDDSNDREFDE